MSQGGYPNNSPFGQASPYNQNFGGAPGPYGQPLPPQKSSSKAIWIIAIVCGLFFISLMVCGVLVGLLLPAVQAARDAARRQMDSNNLKMIGLALHNYHSTYNALPASYTVDSDGNPLLSWRVAITPFLDAPNLADGVDFSKPWDSQENSFLLSQMPSVFASPNEPSQVPGNTNYHIVRSNSPVVPNLPQSMMEPGIWNRFSAVPDGLANTMMVAAVPGDSRPWTQPGGPTPQEFLQALQNTRGTNILLGDGSVRFITSDIPSNTVQQLITPADGNLVGDF